MDNFRLTLFHRKIEKFRINRINSLLDHFLWQINKRSLSVLIEFCIFSKSEQDR